jgi:hypothetical protein
VRAQLFLAVDFLAVDFVAGDFFAVDLLAEDFFAGAFFAELDLLALDLLALDLLALDLLGLDFFVVLLLVDDFEAGAFLAELDFDALDLLADFFAGDDFDADDDFLAADDFEALAFEVVDLEALEDFFAAVLAVFFAAPAALRAPPLAFCATAVAAWPAEDFCAASAALRAASMERCAAGSLSSFLAPETIALRSAPGVNFGTDFFFARIVSPVRGLRTVRALRTCLLNEPKPVIATFSPRATSRVMTSSTDSSACWACLRLPSYRAASVSMSSDLFTGSLS